MPSIAYIYSTVDGHTRKICERLAARAESRNLRSTLVELDTGSSVDLEPFDQVVIGASIRYGKHRPDVARFVDEHRVALEARRAAFFSVNAVARKPEKRDADTNPYVRKFLAASRWQPSLVRVFGGRICYAMYGFFDRTMIRFIMWVTKGPTDLDSDTDFTDWDAVDDFADEICGLAGKQHRGQQI